jgi:hypothetical protein
MKNMAAADTIAPPRIKGTRLPSLVQVLSLLRPTMGCTIRPAIGAASQKRLRSWGSAPMAERILLVLAFCREYPICTPKKPKLIFQICQKLRRGFCAPPFDFAEFGAKAIAIVLAIFVMNKPGCLLLSA